ncbi:MAG: hypothetical protein LiPW15_257 [Parcubacteria group bacterium LiPW_15]|nr:MAG: hypothetical protein LiPW15_257 [Parcubacteria group bacterium LiPW_15]
MKILVIDNSRFNHESARATLKGHDLTIISSFDEAMDIMRKKVDADNVQRLLIDAGFAEKPDYSDREWSAYWQALRESETKSVIPFEFEVVLTDMMMPVSMKTIGPGVYRPGEEVPYGFVIALKAASLGAKFVAMVTDGNHHEDAMIAAIECLNPSYFANGEISSFTINGAKAVFVQAPLCGDRRKDWGKVLADLIS